MKYTLRFVWYILKIIIIALSAFAALAAVFYIAMDSANVYVIVTDGMKARVTSALVPSQSTDITRYFSSEFLSQNALDTTKYSGFSITSIKYDLAVESVWCNPWKNTATVTVVESIPEMAYDEPADLPEGEKAPVPPQWQRARYKLTCIKRNDAWRIDRIDLVKALPPAPTPTPEPTGYITASPLPTPSPSPAPIATPDETPAESPSATK